MSPHPRRSLDAGDASFGPPSSPVAPAGETTTPTETRCPWCCGEGSVPLGGYPDVNGYEREGPCPCDDGTIYGAFNRLTETNARLRAENAAMREDVQRLDWLEAQRDSDTQFCPPGNHGGEDDNWLITLNAERLASPEFEGPSIRSAIDAARHPIPLEPRA